jgi:phage FluMu protein Com
MYFCTVNKLLKIHNSPDQGRYCTATRKIPESKEFTEGAPFTYAFSRVFSKYICAWSLEKSDRPLSICCPHCKDVYYQNSENQAKDFRYHAPECTAFAAVHAMPLNATYKMAMKTLVRAIIRKACENGWDLHKKMQGRTYTQKELKWLLHTEVAPGLNTSVTWQDFEQLVSNRDQYGTARFNARIRMAAKLIKIIPQPLLKAAFPEGHDEALQIRLAEAICRYECNCFGYFDAPEGEQTGAAIIPSISYINHSCAPNADTIYYYPGGPIVLHAIKDIQKNEEINIAYCDTKLSKKARQTYLKDNYFFQCKCPKCQPVKPSESNQNESTLKSSQWQPIAI